MEAIGWLLFLVIAWLCVWFAHLIFPDKKDSAAIVPTVLCFYLLICIFIIWIINFSDREELKKEFENKENQLIQQSDKYEMQSDKYQKQFQDCDYILKTLAR